MARIHRTGLIMTTNSRIPRFAELDRQIAESPAEEPKPIRIAGMRPRGKPRGASGYEYRRARVECLCAWLRGRNAVRGEGG